MEPAAAAPASARPRALRAVRPPSEAAARAAYLRDVTLHLVARELASRYRRSIAGWVWALVPTLIQLAVFNFVFTRVLPIEHAENYALFLLIGIVAWNWFAAGVSLATASLEAKQQLVRRPGFPTHLLPVVAVLVGLVDYLIALPIVVVAVGVVVGFHPAVLFLPVLLAIQLALTIGVGWLLAPVNVFFRDVAHLVAIALTLGFWLTPIFYQRSVVPGRFRLVYDLNPMAQLLEAQRSVFLDGSLPALGTLALVAAAAAAVLAAGFAVFSLLRQSLPEQL